MFSGVAESVVRLDVLTIGERSVNMRSVRRGLRKLSTLSFIFLFTLGVWCASIAAPDLSDAASGADCSKNSLPMPCPNPSFLCASGSFNFLSESAFASVRAYGFSKDTHLPVMALVVASHQLSFAGSRLNASRFIYPVRKVSIHLFNSVLTL